MPHFLGGPGIRRRNAGEAPRSPDHGSSTPLTSGSVSEVRALRVIAGDTPLACRPPNICLLRDGGRVHGLRAADSHPLGRRDGRRCTPTWTPRSVARGHEAPHQPRQGGRASPPRASLPAVRLTQEASTRASPRDRQHPGPMNRALRSPRTCGLVPLRDPDSAGTASPCACGAYLLAGLSSLEDREAERAPIRGVRLSTPPPERGPFDLVLRTARRGDREDSRKGRRFWRCPN